MTDSGTSLHYIVAATPRSGSTLLCELLKASGLAGRPNEDFQALRATSRSRQPRQYFEGVDEPFVERLAPTDPGHAETDDEFAAKLLASRTNSTTDNGVYGTKVMWSYFGDLQARLATLPGLADASVDEALEATFPNLHFIQIQRRDKVAQAISLWTAVQTLSWRDDGDDEAGRHEPVYSYRGIEHLREQLIGQDEAWTRWFATAGVEPVVIAYEDLVADQRGVVLDLLRTLQIDTFDVDVPEPKMRRQSGGRSAEWAERFESERKAFA
jgi:LPS sulfotransferase NodH